MKVLVLNADMQPLNVTSLQRGFKLVYKGKAEVIEYIKDSPIKTSLGDFKRPSIIKLIKTIHYCNGVLIRSFIEILII